MSSGHDILIRVRPAIVYVTGCTYAVLQIRARFSNEDAPPQYVCAPSCTLAPREKRGLIGLYNTTRVFIHFDSNRPIRGFHKTRQTLINSDQTSINSDMRGFIHFESNRHAIRGFHKTRQTLINSDQTSINSDMRVFTHFDSNRPCN